MLPQKDLRERTSIIHAKNVLRIIDFISVNKSLDPTLIGYSLDSYRPQFLVHWRLPSQVSEAIASLEEFLGYGCGMMRAKDVGIASFSMESAIPEDVEQQVIAVQTVSYSNELFSTIPFTRVVTGNSITIQVDAAGIKHKEVSGLKKHVGGWVSTSLRSTIEKTLFEQVKVQRIN